MPTGNRQRADAAEENTTPFLRLDVICYKLVSPARQRAKADARNTAPVLVLNTSGAVDGQGDHSLPPSSTGFSRWMVTPLLDASMKFARHFANLFHRPRSTVAEHDWRRPGLGPKLATLWARRFSSTTTLLCAKASFASTLSRAGVRLDDDQRMLFEKKRRDESAEYRRWPEALLLDSQRGSSLLKSRGRLRACVPRRSKRLARVCKTSTNGIGPQAPAQRADPSTPSVGASFIENWKVRLRAWRFKGLPGGPQKLPLGPSAMKPPNRAQHPADARPAFARSSPLGQIPWLAPCRRSSPAGWLARCRFEPSDTCGQSLFSRRRRVRGQAGERFRWPGCRRLV